jgi:rhamnogalacturonyl hydrolase YesR
MSFCRPSIFRKASIPQCAIWLIVSVATICGSVTAQSVTAQSGTAREVISAQAQAGIQRDIARHLGSAPINAGPRAKLSTAMRTGAIRLAMHKVADWEIRQAQPYWGRNWTWGVLYAGYMAAADSLQDMHYRAAMEKMGSQFHWKLRSAVPSADDQSIAQTYLELYLNDHEPQQIAATQQALQRLMHGQKAPIPAHQAKIPWWWCDALFMAPPVWSRMYVATHQQQYLHYLDEHWWQTSSLLYSPKWHLYSRDMTYRDARGPNGMPVFWSRGEGWVMAGLARTLEYLPVSDPHRSAYQEQFRQMAVETASLQDQADGLWHSNLLDAKDYPLPETSGSALITFALAWGVNQGLLDRATYLPVIRRAWKGLVRQIYASGRLGCIQQTGAAPAHYLPSSSYNYGVGAFLLAGSQVLKLSEKRKLN